MSHEGGELRENRAEGFTCAEATRDARMCPLPLPVPRVKETCKKAEGKVPVACLRGSMPQAGSMDTMLSGVEHVGEGWLEIPTPAPAAALLSLGVAEATLAVSAP